MEQTGNVENEDKAPVGKGEEQGGQLDEVAVTRRLERCLDTLCRTPGEMKREVAELVCRLRGIEQKAAEIGRLAELETGKDRIRQQDEDLPQQQGEDRQGEDLPQKETGPGVLHEALRHVGKVRDLVSPARLRAVFGSTKARLDGKDGEREQPDSSDGPDRCRPGQQGGSRDNVSGDGDGGPFSGALRIFARLKGDPDQPGIPLSRFTAKDWQEVGLDFGKRAASGGLSKGAIRLLTRRAGMPIVFAEAMVNSAMSITTLAMDYRAGRISASDFARGAKAASVEASLEAVATALGSALIPVPVVGPVVGVVAGKVATTLVREILGTKEEALLREMEKSCDEEEAGLDVEARQYVRQITQFYDRLRA